MAMTWRQKEDRRQARYWGKACQHNIDRCRRLAADARAWDAVAQRLDFQALHGTETPEETEERLESIRSFRETAAERRQASDMQLNQVFVNARRAFRSALEFTGREGA
jgi:hypothetical protein